MRCKVQPELMGEMCGCSCTTWPHSERALSSNCAYLESKVKLPLEQNDFVVVQLRYVSFSRFVHPTRHEHNLKFSFFA